jgi:glycosyltransferase involved in cell wall biosynthesis
VIAVGRWDSPQKDGELLAASLGRYYERGGTAEVLIFGNGCDVFSQIRNRWSNVQCRGVQTPETIAEAMLSSRSLLLTSRWESGPIVAFEALCQGCTLVSTDIPNMRELIGSSNFGQISQGRTADAFADALIREMQAWDRVQRDSRQISAHWRPVFRIDSVCQTLQDSAEALKCGTTAGTDYSLSLDRETVPAAESRIR